MGVTYAHPEGVDVINIKKDGKSVAKVTDYNKALLFAQNGPNDIERHIISNDLGLGNVKEIAQYIRDHHPKYIGAQIDIRLVGGWPNGWHSFIVAEA